MLPAILPMIIMATANLNNYKPPVVSVSVHERQIQWPGHPINLNEAFVDLGVW